MYSLHSTGCFFTDGSSLVTAKYCGANNILANGIYAAHLQGVTKVQARRYCRLLRVMSSVKNIHMNIHSDRLDHKYKPILCLI